MKRLMITKNSAMKIQTLVVNHKSGPIKLNPVRFKWIICSIIEVMKEFNACDQVIPRNNNAVWLKDDLFECLDTHIKSQWNKLLFHILNLFESFTWQEHKGTKIWQTGNYKHNFISEMQNMFFRSSHWKNSQNPQSK